MNIVKKDRIMKKRIATAMTIALLSLPFSTTLTLADATTPTSTTSTTTTAAPPLDTSVPTTTSSTTSSTDTTTTTSSGITATPVVDENGNTVLPENWFAELIGKIQLLLTFDPANKVTLNEHQALAKLAEAKKLLEEGKTDAAEACLTQYSDKITQAQDFIDQLKDPNSEAAKALAIALSNVNANNIKVLGDLLDKLPPQAAQRLALNVVRTMEKAVTKLESEGTSASGATGSTTSAAITAASSATTATGAKDSTTAKDTKALEKQAKIALENFKKSLNQKGKIHLDDQDQDQDQDNDGDNGHHPNNAPQQFSNSVPQSVAPQVQAPQSPKTQGTVMPNNSQLNQSMVRSTEKSQKDSDRRGESGEKNDKENHRRD